MILCVGGTPAMQRTLRFEGLALGGVNRACEVLVTASGKVTNAARVVTVLGGRSLMVTFLGGDSGRFVARELDAEGVPHEAVWVEEAPTRTCATLLPDDGPVTELVEEAPPVSEKDVAALKAAVVGHLGAARALCLIGSFPPGVPDDTYARLAEAARDAGVPVLVDAQSALLRSALVAQPLLVKPNLEEAAATLGLSPSGDDENDALSAVAALVEGGARWALVSTGAAGSLLGDASGERWRIESPRVEVVNPIGSGDALAGGLLLSLVWGASVPEAAAYGTACAVANVLTPASGVVRPADVPALLPRVRLRKL